MDSRADCELIDCTLSGDSAAYGVLVTRHQDRLYNSLYRLTGSAEDAQDLAQEAFVQAFRKLASFKRSSAYFTWLYRIAFNLAISQSRKRRPRTSLEAMHQASGMEPVAADGDPETPLLTAERTQLVHQAIAALADDYRQVVVLRELDGCDYQEIAEILDVPIGTVRSRLFRARMQLKTDLTVLLGDPATDNET